MDYLIIMMLVALLIILIMWYYSSNYRNDSIKVDLSGAEDKLLGRWYEEQNKVSIEHDQNPEILASTIISNLYNIDIEPEVLVLSDKLDIDIEHQKLTGKQLIAGETLFTLRDTLGLSLNIAVIPNNKVRQVLIKQEIYSEVFSDELTQLQNIVHNKLFEQAAPYLKKVLEHRWNKLLELSDNRIINNTGSYVYVRNDSEYILYNVIGQHHSDVVRLNLLCSEHEFDLLLKRWRRYMKGLLPSNS